MPTSNCGLTSTTRSPSSRTRRAQGAQHDGQGDEAEVGDDEVEGAAEVLRLDLAHVGARQVGDARVSGDLGGQLAVADVERGDVRGPVLEQHLGEAPGARPDIETPPSPRRRSATSAAAWRSLSAARPTHFSGAGVSTIAVSGRTGSGGLASTDPVDEHDARIDELAGLASRAREPSRHELGVEPT